MVSTDLALGDLGGNALDGRHSFLSGQNGVLQNVYGVYDIYAWKLCHTTRVRHLLLEFC